MITIWVPKRLVEIDLYNVAAQSPAALAEILRAISRDPDSETYRNLRAGAVKASRNYSIEAFAEKLDRLLEEV